MERLWPPQQHRLPVVFKMGNETTGLLKSVHWEPHRHFRDRIKNGTFFVTDHCFDFNLSFYFPHQVTSSPSTVVSDFVIMLNGLNEIHHYHYGHYDRLGASIAFRGMGAALHPTPFHLNRTPFLEADNRKAYEERAAAEGREPQKWPTASGTNNMKRHPARAMMSDPTTLYYCFEQTSNEARDFARLLKREDRLHNEKDKVFYDHFVEPSARVSLLGYSMGGLQALYTFLRYPGLFDKCILINSGVSVDQLNPKPVNIPKDQWDRMAIAAQEAFSEVESDLEDPSLLYEVLFDFEKHIDAFQKVASRVLFISGGADRVAEAEKLQRLAGDEGLNLLEIAGLSHPLESPVFDRWFPLIIEAIELFLRAPRRASLSAAEILSKLASFKIQNVRWDRAIREGRQDQEPVYADRSHNLELEEILERIDGDGEEFLKYYVMSKRYFHDDEELLRAMERER